MKIVVNYEIVDQTMSRVLNHSKAQCISVKECIQFHEAA